MSEEIEIWQPNNLEIEKAYLKAFKEASEVYDDFTLSLKHIKKRKNAVATHYYLTFGVNNDE